MNSKLLLSLEATDQRESFGGGVQPDSFAPKIGVSVPIRVCDDVAWRWSRVKHLPHFEPYWPQAKRDTAITAIIKFLEKNGGDLKLNPPSESGGDY